MANTQSTLRRKGLGGGGLQTVTSLPATPEGIVYLEADYYAHPRTVLQLDSAYVGDDLSDGPQYGYSGVENRGLDLTEIAGSLEGATAPDGSLNILALYTPNSPAAPKLFVPSTLTPSRVIVTVAGLRLDSASDSRALLSGRLTAGNLYVLGSSPWAAQFRRSVQVEIERADGLWLAYNGEWINTEDPAYRLGAGWYKAVNGQWVPLGRARHVRRLPNPVNGWMVYVVEDYTADDGTTVRQDLYKCVEGEWTAIGSGSGSVSAATDINDNSDDPAIELQMLDPQISAAWAARGVARDVTETLPQADITGAGTGSPRCRVLLPVALIGRPSVVSDDVPLPAGKEDWTLRVERGQEAVAGTAATIDIYVNAAKTRGIRLTATLANAQGNALKINVSKYRGTELSSPVIWTTDQAEGTFLQINLFTGTGGTLVSEVVAAVNALNDGSRALTFSAATFGTDPSAINLSALSYPVLSGNSGTTASYYQIASGGVDPIGQQDRTATLDRANRRVHLVIDSGATLADAQALLQAMTYDIRYSHQKLTLYEAVEAQDDGTYEQGDFSGPGLVGVVNGSRSLADSYFTGAVGSFQDVLFTDGEDAGKLELVKDVANRRVDIHYQPQAGVDSVGDVLDAINLRLDANGILKHSAARADVPEDVPWSRDFEGRLGAPGRHGEDGDDGTDEAEVGRIVRSIVEDAAEVGTIARWGANKLGAIAAGVPGSDHMLLGNGQWVHLNPVGREVSTHAQFVQALATHAAYAPKRATFIHVTEDIGGTISGGAYAFKRDDILWIGPYETFPARILNLVRSRERYVSRSTAYTLTSGDWRSTQRLSGDTAREWDLPQAANAPAGYWARIVNGATENLTLTPFSGGTIGGAANLVLTPGRAVTLLHVGANAWAILTDTEKGTGAGGGTEDSTARASAAAAAQAAAAAAQAAADVGHLEVVDITSASDYQSAMNAQRTSQVPKLLRILSPISGSRGGAAYAWDRYDVLYTPPLSGDVTPVHAFNLKVPDVVGTRSGAHTITEGERATTQVLTGSTARTWTLPETATVGWSVRIVNRSTAVLTLARAGSHTINGNATRAVPAGATVRVMLVAATAFQIVSDTEKGTSSGGGTQADWEEADTGDPAFIKNKPTLGTAAAADTGTGSGNVPVLDGSGDLPESVIPESIARDREVTAAVNAMRDLLRDNAPSNRDTLKELADALAAITPGATWHPPATSLPTAGVANGQWALRTGDTNPGIYYRSSGSWTRVLAPGTGSGTAEAARQGYLELGELEALNLSFEAIAERTGDGSGGPYSYYGGTITGSGLNQQLAYSELHEKMIRWPVPSSGANLVVADFNTLDTNEKREAANGAHFEIANTGSGRVTISIGGIGSVFPVGATIEPDGIVEIYFFANDVGVNFESGKQFDLILTPHDEIEPRVLYRTSVPGANVGNDGDLALVRISDAEERWYTKAAGSWTLRITKTTRKNTTKTGTYTITAGDLDGLVRFTGLNNSTFNLPNRAGQALIGRWVEITNESGNGSTLTLDGNGSDTIDGEETLVLQAGQAVKLRLVGTSAWRVVADAGRGGGDTNLLLADGGGLERNSDDELKVKLSEIPTPQRGPHLPRVNELGDLFRLTALDVRSDPDDDSDHIFGYDITSFRFNGSDGGAGSDAYEVAYAGAGLAGGAYSGSQAFGRNLSSIFKAGGIQAVYSIARVSGVIPEAWRQADWVNRFFVSVASTLVTKADVDAGKLRFRLLTDDRRITSEVRLYWVGSAGGVTTLIGPPTADVPGTFDELRLNDVTDFSLRHTDNGYLHTDLTFSAGERYEAGLYEGEGGSAWRQVQLKPPPNVLLTYVHNRRDTTTTLPENFQDWSTLVIGTPGNFRYVPISVLMQDRESGDFNGIDSFTLSSRRLVSSNSLAYLELQ